MSQIDPTNDDSAAPFWRALIVRLVLIFGFASIIGAFAGLKIALIIVIGGLLILLAAQANHLATLQRWLRMPDDDHFPQAGGEWGEVFIQLSRRFQELQSIGEVANEERKALADAVNALPDGVILLDAHNQILWCNRGAESHLGIDGQRDIGIVLVQLFRVPGFGEYLSSKTNNEPFVFQSPVAPSRTYALEVIHYGRVRKLAVTFDITELRRADAIRRDFVANVSHELRTPLTVVSGFLEHLANDDAKNISHEDRQRFVHLMNDQSMRMLRLVDDLLTLSRLDADDGPQNEEYIVLSEFIAQLVNEAQNLSANRHHFVLEGEIQGRLRGSRHELQSAFGNLLSNAIRYTPEGGNITVRWQIQEGEGIFSVKDSGVGIAAEHLPRLTERFYRVDKGRSRETGGTGLGLAIVKNALLRHQAQLKIDSTPGAGSTFSAHFPQWRCYQ